ERGVDGRSYARHDSAKVNIAPHPAKARWSHLVGKNIGNATKEYPNGDTIQVAEPWSPPDAWKDTTAEGLNAILNDIAKGTPKGQRYSNASAAGDERQGWPLGQKHYPNKSGGECRTIIHAWLNNKLLYPDDYDDPVAYKKRKGLNVDDEKRPN